MDAGGKAGAGKMESSLSKRCDPDAACLRTDGSSDKPETVVAGKVEQDAAASFYVEIAPAATLVADAVLSC